MSVRLAPRRRPVASSRAPTWPSTAMRSAARPTATLPLGQMISVPSIHPATARTRSSRAMAASAPTQAMHPLKKFESLRESRQPRSGDQGRGGGDLGPSMAVLGRVWGPGSRVEPRGILWRVLLWVPGWENQGFGGPGGVLGASWGLLGASRGVLGASRGRLGASWGVLGASWGVLGRLGGVLGPS